MHTEHEAGRYPSPAAQQLQQLVSVHDAIPAVGDLFLHIHGIVQGLIDNGFRFRRNINDKTMLFKPSMAVNRFDDIITKMKNNEPEEKSELLKKADELWEGK